MPKSSNDELYRKPPDPKMFELLETPFGSNERMDIDDDNPMNVQGKSKSTLDGKSPHRR